MKKEGTGKPRNPDIAIDASVNMRELRFEKVPDPEVHFRGNTARNSVWRSRRTNLPEEVEEDVVYRDAGIRLRIATEIAESPSDFGNSSDHERVRTNPENELGNTIKQRPRNEKEQR
jgi:hypothetical protein